MFSLTALHTDSVVILLVKALQYGCKINQIFVNHVTFRNCERNRCICTSCIVSQHHNRLYNVHRSTTASRDSSFIRHTIDKKITLCNTIKGIQGVCVCERERWVGVITSLTEVLESFCSLVIPLI